MNKLEIYSLLFTDSFTSNLAINTSEEIIIHTIKTFGTASLKITVTVATAASLVANIINYFLGKILFNVFNAAGVAEQQTIRNHKLAKLVKYNKIFLLLSIIPFFGKFVPVVAGFSKFPFVSTILICTGLKLSY